MTKQKKGFLLFLCSLLPGAGELYMGFRKMGISLSLLFWGVIACASLLNFPALTFLLPILWLYSFFNVHNLKSLTEEEFMNVEDHYILFSLFNSGEELQNGVFVKKYRKLIAIILIILGIGGLWNIFFDLLMAFIPSSMIDQFATLGFQVPGFALSIALIVIGVKLILGKKEELDHESDNNSSL